MAVEINVLFEIKPGNRQISKKWLKSVMETTLNAEHTGLDIEAGLVITGQQQIHNLNLAYLDEDRPTDVLSFPMLPAAEAQSSFVTPPDGKKHLGEVIISLPQAITQAAEHGHSIRREIAILLIHGTLHLLGYDHDVPEAETKMKARENHIFELISSSL